MVSLKNAVYPNIACEPKKSGHLTGNTLRANLQSHKCKPLYLKYSAQRHFWIDNSRSWKPNFGQKKHFHLIGFG